MANGHDADTPEPRSPRELVPADDELTPADAFQPVPSLEVDSTLSIAVDLPPAPPPEIPEDEAAVAIDEVPVDPGFVASPTEPTTMSVAIVASRLATTPPEAADGADATRAADGPDAAPLPAGEPYAGSRRDRLRGEHSTQPEPAAMLTADRLLEVNRKTRPGPEGPWQRFVYNVTFRTVNLGDSAKVRARKELDHRIQKHFEGGARFVPVLTRKGGVGKTTVTTLLGMALASAREDRIIAIDANPDRGTLSERVPRQTRSTVRDVVHKAASIGGFTDFSSLVSRDETRLDILASDTDPMLSEAFDENDYNVVADLSARFYSIVLTDCGTGIVHSVMRATLQRADSLVIVSGGSVDEARLASETLTWLEANGYGDLVRNAVVALNTATHATNLVKLEEIEAHFRSRVREIVRVPYDPQLAAGSVVSWKDLKPLTRLSARTLAALVVEGLPAERD
ncbi:MinD/ParA family protein [Leifsonia shinshuensis]|uniref:MinD/ParA family ATP-binding protein n=1 Tax=Leifsonia shinshuensis TaxID=150026 RepID=UPI002856FF25|nr:MinD/ParA family protein [Leifsonia shinshuensis]MDR6970923.1 MinD-like ATPase involved in chromosome partitioning or flagellar assembly [Leifsonia shinshuensis]